MQLAFLSDVHLHDIYANFSNTNYKGIENPVTGKYNVIRSMDSQLHSTRLFNENYFAFQSALQEVAKRGIKIVALPGDFTDDGQPANVKALKSILETFEKQYDIQFFITTGNHDPVRPFPRPGGKHDFLAEDGSEQIIVSDSSLMRQGSYKNPPIITPDVQFWGYQDIAETLSGFGFFPKASNLFWQTPFSTYNFDTYNFDLAKSQSELDKRTYNVQKSTLKIPDVSYVVEPVEGLWLLAIDGNVYLPKNETSTEFGGASGNGYNGVIQHKKHLVSWVKQVVLEAKKHNKKLVAFSHYPMVEFNDGATNELKQLFGDNKMQLVRVPNLEVAETFASLGLQLHFGGHMHANDTGVHKAKNGQTLFNIQTPSLAGYMPAYKVLTFNDDTHVKVETVVLDSVLNYNELFPLYEKEHAYLKASQASKIWNKEVLQAQSYLHLTDWHLKELVRLRFLPNDWPEPLKEKLLNKTGKALLLSVQDASNAINLQILEDLDSWTINDMLVDFYRLKLSDGLVYKQIGAARLNQYKMLSEALQKGNDADLKLFGTLFLKTMSGQPSVNFSINLNNNSIKALED
ncbi:metallophosphoesterase family protein [Neotamlana nanhaiensis]|uniref:metallophosphoesterase family protein n=1 Tax=Neotamlana nanhaiensis TaxID=1382798 RepID=UPI001EE20851|nr:metallophosphoesterase [Tamlana nanhaiensis]